ncbi:MAG: hypothetical protein ACR2P8_11125 [Myxococcota bacterium]
MSEPREGRLERWWIAALALAASALVAVSLRHGMPMSLDGWFYWQGSVSLLEGLGFRAFDGQPIEAWPPLYSSTLAAAQRVAGVSARSLALSTALVTGIAVLGWAGLIRWYAGRRGDRSRVVLAVAWVAVLLVLNARELRAENLARALLPLLVWATLRGGGAVTRRELFVSACAAALTLLALLATRNPALALAPRPSSSSAAWALAPSAPSRRPSPSPSRWRPGWHCGWPSGRRPATRSASTPLAPARPAISGSSCAAWTVRPTSTSSGCRC